MKIELIETGFFYADGGAMFGAIPKTAWLRRYPCDADNKCILAMRSALVSCDDGRIILIDNGAGNKHLRMLSYYKFFNLVDLKEELLLRGVNPEDITDVVLTHLHFDHCGYTTLKNEKDASLSPAFPQATHWVSRLQWEICQHPNNLEKDSFKADNIEAVFNSGRLCLIDTDTDINSCISLRLFGGHTPAQIAVYIHEHEGGTIFAGDVIPLMPNVSPEWISAYDMQPQTSYCEKLRMLDEAAAGNYTIIYCHDAYNPSSGVKKINSATYKAVIKTD